jgi:hypothetical protein
MHHRLLFRLQVGYLHGPHDLDRERECLLGRAAASLRPNIAASFPQLSQHLRTIKPLTLAVFAEAHDSPSTSL